MKTESIRGAATRFRVARGVAIAGLLALTLGACETSKEVGNTVSDWGKGAANWTSRQYDSITSSSEKSGSSSQANSGEANSGQATKAAYTPPPATYSATGIATWYPRKSQGRKTSSGDRLDNNGLTAAHRTLPMGTKVRITNLSNRRSIIVTINDNRIRNKHRLIQLTRKAATQLGVLGKSTGHRRVRIEAIGS